MNCDDCTQPKSDCPACHKRRAAIQAQTDRELGRLREDGYWSPYMLRLNEEAEQRAVRLGYQ